MRIGDYFDKVHPIHGRTINEIRLATALANMQVLAEWPELSKVDPDLTDRLLRIGLHRLIEIRPVDLLDFTVSGRVIGYVDDFLLPVAMCQMVNTRILERRM